MKDFEINILNVNHESRDIQSHEIKGLVVSLKYDYLKSKNLFFDKTKLPSYVKDSMKVINLIYTGQPGLKANSIFNKPLMVDKSSQFYYVVSEYKVYNFMTDNKIEMHYRYFDWFFAISMLQTPDRELKWFFDRVLSDYFNDSVKDLFVYIKRIFKSFDKKKVPNKFQLFDSFYKVKIDLFREYGQDKNDLQEWFALWKDSKL